MLADLVKRERPWQWGVADCALTIADWLIVNGHDDPALELRGAYSDEASCLALLQARGGLLEVVADCAAQAGLSEIAEPEVGCIAVIGAAENPARQRCAIRSETGWVTFTERGFLTLHAAPVRMWRVECRS